MFGAAYFGQNYGGQGYAEQSIVFDAASSSAYQASLSSYSWSHTCGLSARGLIVSVSLFATGTVSSITYNSVALTFVRADTSGVYRNEIWALEAPAYGAHTVAVTLSASLTSIASALSYGNVDQADMIEAHAGATGTGGTPTVSVTPTEPYAWVVSGISTANTAVTPASSQTARANNTGALGTGAAADYGPITTPASTAANWSAVGTLDGWALGVVALNPAEEPAVVRADATAATGTGAANNGSAALIPNAGNGGATGAAYSAVAQVTSSAGNAPGTGTASDATVAGIETAGIAAGTGTAYGAVPAGIETAEIAAGTGGASATSASIVANAADAAGAGVAYDAAATVAVSAAAQPATGTATAYDITATVVVVNAGSASGVGIAYGASEAAIGTTTAAIGTGAAFASRAALVVNAGNGAGVGAAYDATVIAGVVAHGDVASGTGAAFGAAAVIAAPTITAAGTGSASAGFVRLTANAGLGAGTGTASNAVATAAYVVSASAASGTGSSANATALAVAPAVCASGFAYALDGSTITRSRPPHRASVTVTVERRATLSRPGNDLLAARQ